MENWSSLTDALERLTALGVGATFDYRPFHEVTFYDPRLNRIAARSAEPLFYLVRRGPEEGSFDRALLDQAREAGAEVLLGQPSRTARRRDIVAIGPRYAGGLATGHVFPTQLESGALTARSLLEGFDYSAVAQRHFESRRAVAFSNRLVYERLPAPIIAPVLRRGASSTDLRQRVRRHLRATRLKILVSRVAFGHFARTRLQHRDRACHTTTCDCVWCSSGPVDPARRA
ncbi:MAG: NAD(P)/FAD-dependent oxidoreductase [Acidimicrobiia bacterium]